MEEDTVDTAIHTGLPRMAPHAPRRPPLRRELFSGDDNSDNESDILIPKSPLLSPVPRRPNSLNLVTLVDALDSPSSDSSAMDQGDGRDPDDPSAIMVDNQVKSGVRYVTNLGKNMYLNVVLLPNTDIIIDIRRFINNANYSAGTCKGITIPLDRMKTIFDETILAHNIFAPVLRGEERNYRRHLGGGMFFCIQSPYKCVNIRNFKEIDDKLIPGDGIALNSIQWDKFRDFVYNIEKIIPEYANTRRFCTHNGKKNFVDCPECKPYNTEIMDRVMNIDE